MSRYQSQYKTYDQITKDTSSQPEQQQQNNMGNIDNIPSAVVDVQNVEHFRQLLKQKPVVVLDAYADWCQPCKAIAPQYTQLAINYSKYPQLGFCKINVDNADTHDICTVNAVPTFFIYYQGQQKEKIDGGNLMLLVQKLNEIVSQMNVPQRPQRPQRHNHAPIPQGYTQRPPHQGYNQGPPSYPYPHQQ